LILNFLAGAGDDESVNADAGNRVFLRCCGTSGDENSPIEMQNIGQNAVIDFW
jgi:hypothetical protein